MNSKLNISLEDIQKLLDAHERHGQLFVLYIGSLSVVFRLLTVSELKTIGHMINFCDPDGIDDWIVKRTVVWSSRSLDESRAGYTNAVSKKVISKSSLSENDYMSIVEEARSKTNTLDNVISSLLIKVKPTDNPEALDMIERSKQQVFCETVLNTKIEFDTKPTKGGPKRPKGFMSLETAQVLSKENADIPNFDKDNAQLRNL